MLPNTDGLSICRTIRGLYPRLPVIFLTAKTDTADLVTGFESGGTDYIKKPFSIEELIAIEQCNCCIPPVHRRNDTHCIFLAVDFKHEPCLMYSIVTTPVGVHQKMISCVQEYLDRMQTCDPLGTVRYFN